MDTTPDHSPEMADLEAILDEMAGLQSKMAQRIALGKIGGQAHIQALDQHFNLWQMQRESYAESLSKLNDLHKAKFSSLHEKEEELKLKEQQLKVREDALTSQMGLRDAISSSERTLNEKVDNSLGRCENVIITKLEETTHRISSALCDKPSTELLSNMEQRLNIQDKIQGLDSALHEKPSKSDVKAELGAVMSALEQKPSQLDLKAAVEALDQTALGSDVKNIEQVIITLGENVGSSWAELGGILTALNQSLQEIASRSDIKVELDQRAQRLLSDMEKHPSKLELKAELKSVLSALEKHPSKLEFHQGVDRLLSVLSEHPSKLELKGVVDRLLSALDENPSKVEVKAELEGMARRLCSAVRNLNEGKFRESTYARQIKYLRQNLEIEAPSSVLVSRVQGMTDKLSVAMHGHLGAVQGQMATLSNRMDTKFADINTQINNAVNLVNLMTETKAEEVVNSTDFKLESVQRRLHMHITQDMQELQDDLDAKVSQRLDEIDNDMTNIERKMKDDSFTSEHRFESIIGVVKTISNGFGQPRPPLTVAAMIGNVKSELSEIRNSLKRETVYKEALDSAEKDLEKARIKESDLVKKNAGLQDSVKDKAMSIRELMQQVRELQSALDSAARRSPSPQQDQGNEKESQMVAENHRLSQRVGELEQKLQGASQVQLDVSTLEPIQAAMAELSQKMNGITIDSDRTRQLEKKMDEVTQERDEAKAKMALLEDQAKVTTDTRSKAVDPRKRARRDSSNLSEDMVVFGNACQVLASNLREVKVRFLEPSDGSSPRGSDLVYGLASILRHEDGQRRLSKVKSSTTAQQWKCFGNICAFPLDDPRVVNRCCGCMVVIPNQCKCLQVRVEVDTDLHEFCFQDLESSQSSQYMLR